jgi:hypothetical protein
MDDDGLADAISERSGRRRGPMRELLTTIIDAMAHGLDRDRALSLEGFGAFVLRERPASATTPAAFTVEFTPDLALLASLHVVDDPARATARPFAQDWKPAAALRAHDFVRSAVWGYDLERAEAQGSGADETFVRPFTGDELERDSDVVWVRATMRLACGDETLGAVEARLVDGEPVVQGALVFLPGDRTISGDRDDPRVFPARYQAQLRARGRIHALAGTVGAP